MSPTSPPSSIPSKGTAIRSEAAARRALYLFSRDLRLDDHAGLASAARSGAIVPALILDPATQGRLARSPRRAAYFRAAVEALAAELEARGSTLVIRRGPLVSTAKRLAREAGVATVAWSAAYDSATREEQRRLQAALEESGFRALAVHDAPAVSPEETAAARTDGGGSGYRALAPYVAAWLAAPRIESPGEPRFAAHGIASEPLPSPREFDERGDPGELPELGAAALAAFERYLAGPALQYPTARHVPAGPPTSHLAAPLSFGTISPRTVLRAIDRRARDPYLLAEERRALAKLVRSLAQRDFFYQLAWYFEDAPDEPLQPHMRGFHFAPGHPQLEAWLAGRTGYPLVDAGMRQLAATGWMHPRVRLVAASFLCFDLGVDWRVGRAAWDRSLIEDDPALATGNWQWVAGVGADLAQHPRIFHPLKQARAYDAKGAYVRRWVSELAGLPDADVLDPRSAAERGQLALPLFGAHGYPAPILDHEPAAQAFLERYAAARRQPGGGARLSEFDRPERARRANR
jgi:deoxyribodipyrimidine photo-lyase